ncbi:MAG TPA: hypothetical protein VF104_09750 [Burkholderiales bacterium]
MNQATDPLNSVYAATMDSAERSVSLALQGTASLFNCNMGVARNLLAIAEKQLAEWPSQGTSSMEGVDWPALFKSSAERAMELTRACAEVGTSAQSEFVRLSQEQMDLLGKIWQENIQGVARVAEAAGNAGVEPIAQKH